MHQFHHGKHPIRVYRYAVLEALACLHFALPASAQISGLLPGGLGSGQGGNLLGRLGGGSAGLPSVTQAGPANTAGVLQYCVQNNYLSGGAAGSVKTALSDDMASLSARIFQLHARRAGFCDCEALSDGGGTFSNVRCGGEGGHRVCRYRPCLIGRGGVVDGGHDMPL